MHTKKITLISVKSAFEFKITWHKKRGKMLQFVAKSLEKSYIKM